jgi:hypothetical protein
MQDSSVAYMQTPRRFHFSWLAGVILRPTQTFTAIVNQRSANWLTPILALTLAILLNTFAQGWINQQAALTGNVQLPPDFQYWMPEQQEQYMQSQQIRQGPVFHYVIPAIFSVSGAWIGWLLVGGMTHLVMTLLGGRGETGISMNLVAWASIPLALRELVQAAYHFITQQLIVYKGLSGFIEPTGESLSAFLVSFLALVDVYLIWHILLLILGARLYTGITRGKAIGGIILVIGIVVLAQAGLGYMLSQISQLAIVRPYFF